MLGSNNGDAAAIAILSPPHVVTLSVAGMTCTSCVNRVKDALVRFEGVASVLVSLENSRADVVLAPNANLNPEDLAKAVRDESGKDASVLVSSACARVVALNVNGMSCMGCVGRVKETIENMESVLSAEVSLENSRADIVLIPSAKISADDIARIVTEETGKDASSLLSDVDPRSYVLRVDGMTCMGCVGRVKDALSAIHGVSSVEVSLQSGLANVVLESGASVDPEELVRVVCDDAGKNASVFQVDGEARKLILRVNGMTCMGCVGRVKDTLESIPDVEFADVSLENSRADVRLSPGSVMDAAEIARIVQEQTGKEALEMAEPQQTEEHGCIALCIEGMTCMSCVKRVKGALEGVAGVRVADVSLETGIAKVRLYPDALVVTEDLICAVRDQVGKEANAVPSSLQIGSIPDVLNMRQSDDFKTVQSPTFESTHVKTSPAMQALSPVAAGRHVDHSASPVLSAIDLEIEDGSRETGSTSVVLTTLKIGGMTCSSCVGLVEKVITAIPAVQSARVNLLAGRASVRHDCSVTKPQMIVQVVESAGYSCSVLSSGGNSKQVRAKTALVVFECESSHQAVAALNVLRTNPQTHGVLDAEVSESNMLRARLSPSADIVTILRILELAPDVGPLKLSVDASADVNAYTSTSYREDEVSVWRSRFAMALCFTLPLMIVGFVSNHTKLISPGVAIWLEFAFATPVQFICGRGFYRSSYFALRKGRATMDVLIALSTSIAYFTSIAVLLQSAFRLGEMSSVDSDSASSHIRGIGHSAMFNVSAMIITIVLLGKWLESTAKRRAADGVAALSALAPTDAVVFDGDLRVARQTRVPVSLLRVGDFVRLAPGERVPVDAVVVEGRSAINESMLTGESHLVPKFPGDFVYGGTINESNNNGTMLLQTAAVDSEAVLAQIVRLVDEAQTSRAPIEAYADRMSAVFVPSVVTLAVLVFISWYLLASFSKIPLQWYADEGAFTFALLFALETMVIACPCALGLATPTAVMVASEVGTRMGVLVRGGGAALEAAQGVKTILFDKTGTLTMGKPQVVAVVVGTQAHSDSKDQASSLVTALVGAIEVESRHPLASALVNYANASRKTSPATEQESSPFKICEVEELPGRGMRATLNDGEYVVTVGSRHWAVDGRDRKLMTDKELDAVDRLEQEEGLTVVAAVVNNTYVVVFGLEDSVRPEAADVISYLQHNLGITCGMVTGDSEGTALAVARKVGIESSQIVSRALPWTKVDTIKSLPPGTSCFVGDGINDAPALAAADVGIAIGAGAQIASENASIVLVRSDLNGVVQTLDLARKSFSRVRLNFVWALAYNLLGIPLAAGAFYPFFQVRVPPILASGSMALSSTCVVLSSLALRWYTPPVLQTSNHEDAFVNSSIKQPALGATEMRRRLDSGPTYVLVDDNDDEVTFRPNDLPSSLPGPGTYAGVDSLNSKLQSNKSSDMG